MFPTELSGVENPLVALVEYRKSNADFIAGEGVLYTEFMGEIATRQINLLDGIYYPSASLKDRNDKIGFLLYDGRKSDLNLSYSPIISKEEFESVWNVAMEHYKETSKIQYITGDATIPVHSSVIISHIVNNQRKWGRGFVLSLSKRYSSVRSEYLKGCNSVSELTLGNVQFVSVDEKNRVFVANMIAQDGIKKSYNDRKKYVSYQALDKCLSVLSEFALINRLSVQMPRIGSGLGGGDWNYIESLIEKNLCHKLIKCVVISL